MSYGVDRGPEVVYRVPWGAPDSAAPALRSAPIPAPPPGVVAADRVPSLPTPAPALPRHPGPPGSGTSPLVPASAGPVAGDADEDTPLYAASAVLDRSALAVPALGAEDTPLFDAVPHYDAVVRADEERLVRTFRAMPGPWQEILWYTLVEEVSVTEASVHVGLDAAEADALAAEAVAGLRRGWVADDLDARDVPLDCASALWALCGHDGWRGLGHVRDCEDCGDVARRLEDVLVRTPQVLLSVALAQLDDARQDRAQGAFDRAV